jgi:hypothetical protein
MKNTLTPILVLVVSMYILLEFTIKGYRKSQELRNQYIVNLGKTFVFENDTLIIVNYSILTETFVLSNGMEVNSKIILNNR